MKEVDYLLAQELARVKMLTHLIAELHPNKSDLITDEEFIKMSQIAHKWQDKLFQAVKIEE